MAGRTLPEGRYGPRRDGRWLPGWAANWATPVLLALVVAAGLVVAVVGYRNLGPAPIEGAETAFEVLDDHAVRVTFEVVRNEPSRPGVCIVRARSVDGDETGRKEVYVPPGDRSELASTVLRTSRRPVTGEVFGCSYQVPVYLRPEQVQQRPAHS